MNKKSLVLCTALLLSTGAAGCSDAQAKIKDSSTVLFSVGNKSITKGDLYSLMNATAGATTAINDANKMICDQEIEITDEMKESAEKTLTSYKSMYGDTFASYLEQSNMTEDDYLNDYLIPSLQAEKLTEKYITDNWNSVVSFYKPVKATVLEFTTTDDAKAALSELNDGSASPAEAASNHNSSSNGQASIYTIESQDVDSLVRAALNSNTPDDGWKEIPASNGSAFYLIRIEDNTPDNFKDEVMQAFESIDQISNDATTYFFKKYNFVIYDKIVYDAVEANYPNNLVQNMKDTKSDTTNGSAE